MHVVFIGLHKLRFPSGWTPHTLAQMQSVLITGDGRHLKIALACIHKWDYLINHNEIPRQITFELLTFTSFFRGEGNSLFLTAVCRPAALIGRSDLYMKIHHSSHHMTT